ncbi:formylmethanofuran dehydrogenase subunit C [Ideonella sp. 4Y11]|uniref:Formylmethanofuran dehydrogenase subunit C n=1 Tax=Ideonella aquatica TaxID=2824119 RepID=A0A940YI50_9BURK|nr:formylmethanofuran dehydrogenase subunit C [Ideonella aquatica]MBQ0960678.1 formylmethanofuran dehydrogenase subunit C [Ideonella aquatica]
MNRWHLHLRHAPEARLDLRSIGSHLRLAPDADTLAALPLACGRDQLPLGTLFDIAPLTEGDADLRLSGDLSRADRIGWQWSEGVLEVIGGAGHHLGTAMSGGTVRISGDAGDGAGIEMRGGELRIGGHAGDYLASTLPGSMDGMRGGLIVVDGSVGARCADRMRRGTVIVRGDAGDFLCSRLVAGTVLLGGRCGAHPAWGMRRGTLLLAGPAPADLGDGFVPDHADHGVFLALLTRDLARHGGVAAALVGRPARFLRGDLAVDGRGEVLLFA